jgi:hypothetical protein
MMKSRYKEDEEEMRVDGYGTMDYTETASHQPSTSKLFEQSEMCYENLDVCCFVYSKLLLLMLLYNTQLLNMLIILKPIENVKQIKVKVKREIKKMEQPVKLKGKSSIRTMIKAAKSRD